MATYPYRGGERKDWDKELHIYTDYERDLARYNLKKSIKREFSWRRLFRVMRVMIRQPLVLFSPIFLLMYTIYGWSLLSIINNVGDTQTKRHVATFSIADIWSAILILCLILVGLLGIRKIPKNE